MTILPIGQTAAYLTNQQLSNYQSLNDFPEYLAAQQTVVTYIDPNKTSSTSTALSPGWKVCGSGKTCKVSSTSPSSRS
jgi:hypothetical protein